MSARATTLCPGAGDRIRDYFMTVGVVPLAQQYHSYVTVTHGAFALHCRHIELRHLRRRLRARCQSRILNNEKST